MITTATTQVWVRVDLASKRPISVNDEPMEKIAGKPVFQVAANFARLDYYIVEDNAAAEYGITVRAANADERSAADSRAAAATTAVANKVKKQKVVDIRALYSELFLKRFTSGRFASAGEIMEAAAYAGSDTLMTETVKPLALSILDAKVEWRQTVCQPIIDALVNDGTDVDLTDMYRLSVEASLDTFLSTRGFDIATYHR